MSTRAHTCRSHTRYVISSHVSRCGVAGQAETFQCLPGSGLFLPDFPEFHIPSDCVLPSQPGSSSRTIPRQVLFGNCSDVFCCTSSFGVPEYFPSLDHANRVHLSFLQDLISKMFLHCPSHHPHICCYYSLFVFC